MLAPWIIIGYVIIGVILFSIGHIKARKAMDEPDEYELNIPANIIVFVLMVIFWPALIFISHPLLKALRSRAERKKA